MLQNLWTWVTGGSSDLPPVYQSVDPLSQLSPDSSERDTPTSARTLETPRKRFNYHVKLRQIQQVEEWRRTSMGKEHYTNLIFPEILARDWVIKQWQDYGIWASTWSDTGPGDEERWECGSPEGIPVCLLFMELRWEMEHTILVHNPMFLPCLADPGARLPTNIQPVTWEPQAFVQQALSQLSARWNEEGFASSKIQQSTLQYRQNLPELYTWLPPSARGPFQLLKVRSWSSLLDGWETKIGDDETDRLGLPLPSGSRAVAEAAVAEAQAESRRVEALRRKSPLLAPAAQQEVTRAARLNGTDSPGAEESKDTPGCQSRAVKMSDMSEPSIESREIPTEATHDAPKPTNRRSTRGAQRDATRLTTRIESVQSEGIARLGAAVSAATGEGMRSSARIASRGRSGLTQSVKRRRVA